MSPSGLEPACRTLLEHYSTENWWPARTRFEIMVGAVLVQNTRWSNVSAAIYRLRRAGRLSPEPLAKCAPERLTGLIRPAGCQSVKARRLLSLARWVVQSGGLWSLAVRDTDTLRRGLLGVHGIGPETADAMLCYAFVRPTFVADQYARRWLRRMGFAENGQGAEYEQCRAWIEDELRWSGAQYQGLHAAMVLHGQTVCGRRPACGGCVFFERCQCCLRDGKSYPAGSLISSQDR